MRGLVLLGCGGCVVGAVDRDVVLDGATSVEVAVGNGSTIVETSPDDLLRVSVDGGGVGVHPDVAQREDGAVFVDLTGALGGGDVELRLPAGIPLVVTVDRGDVDVALEAASDLDVCVGAGDASLGLPAGGYALDVGLGAGDVSEDGIWHDPDSPWAVSVCVGAGSIDVYAFDPDQ